MIGYITREISRTGSLPLRQFLTKSLKEAQQHDYQYYRILAIFEDSRPRILEENVPPAPKGYEPYYFGQYSKGTW